MFRLESLYPHSLLVHDSLPYQPRLEEILRFAKMVFWIAGIWGLLVIPPL
jgi:hypothetical protein